MTNCTVANNTTGIYNQLGDCGNTIIRNSVLWANGIGDLQSQVIGASDIEYSCVQGISTGGGSNNINTDPDFVDPDDDFRLTLGSDCIDAGDNVEVVEDTGDVNQNGVTAEPTADLDLRVRIQCVVDMGAYELDSTGCLGDVDNNCVVDVDDLLAVINSWGVCGSPCPADIAPDCVDGDVDIDDLLAVINGWGDCEGICANGQGVAYSSSMPQSVGDCMDECSERFPGGGSQWSNCVDDCVTALCIAEILECD